jgi:hypothetical protein
VSREITVPGFPILDGLRAGGPDPGLGEGLMTFGQFVGVWGLDVGYFDEAGRRTYHGRWEWSFAWILGGRAIQDVIVGLCPPDQPGRRPLGTTIRYLDPGSEEWTVFYLGAVRGITVQLHGRAADGQIVLEGPDPDGTLNQWTFSDISPAAFTWTGLESRDGRPWRLNQRMLATRLA